MSSRTEETPLKHKSGSFEPSQGGCRLMDWRFAAFGVVGVATVVAIMLMIDYARHLVQ